MGGEAALLSLHTLICSVWSTGVIPTDWKQGIVVPIWKGKGDVRECNNYRGVTLLSVPGKVFARVILNRVRQQLLKHQRPEQSGFTPKRSTASLDFVSSQSAFENSIRSFWQPISTSRKCSTQSVEMLCGGSSSSGGSPRTSSISSRLCTPEQKAL